MKMSEYYTYLQTVAAICSAIAAIASVCVARSTFSFQRNFLLKKASIDQILKLLSQLNHLRSLTGQPVLAAADGDVTGLQQQITETIASVRALEYLVSAPASANVKRFSISYMACAKQTFSHRIAIRRTPRSARQSLSDAITALHNIYHTEIK